MAILTKAKAPSAHWYRADGTPSHHQQKADGQRMTTLRDARKLGLYPSVTGVMDILAKPGLDKWKRNETAKATLRVPKQPEESEEYWLQRVDNEAFAQVETAADLGSSIHTALEDAMDGKDWDDKFAAYVKPVMEWKLKTGIEIVEREIRVVNKKHGFAGTADVLFRFGKRGIGILDYKTRKTKPGVKIVAYDNQALQLAAYGATYWGNKLGDDCIPRIVAANVFISSTEPGRMAIVKHEHLPRDWEAFKLIAELWRYIKNYDPRTTT